ncbi:S41 family peptidase [Hymenobacter sp. M29]|uniref:S41 family peptidase n=1 Tax=Hymenobacter mellowenesis TaxID=3063995 RepID=A0ABT9A7B8_9BACT|nr:S41 family peptidase [Hymenobacter sp. M29]MDO7845239.1 S41 family peptidase [Hymenobacter sp. M29]
MKHFCLFLALLLAVRTAAPAQTTPAPNLDFERIDRQTGRLADWWAQPNGVYEMAADSVVRHQGQYSLRIRSANKKPDSKEFGVATLRIPASFRGKIIKLTGFMKTENIRGSYAGLWMRVDGDQETIDFQNTSKLNVQGTTDWTPYTIDLSLGTEARAVLLGGLTPGTGTLWLDDFVLTVDGQPLSQAPAQVIKQYKAAQDTAFRRRSGIALDNLSPAQIENLAVLGRVWGFVKYYHPAVARGDYNWDAELLRVLPRVLSSPGAPARNAVLSAWLAGLGPVPACTTCREPGGDTIRLRPDLAWLTDEKTLGPALSRQLEYLRLNRNQGPHYYVRAAQAGNPVFRHEQAYAHTAIPDAGLRLLALYRYWNMVQYFFPYRYAIGEDWKQILPEFIPQFATATTAENYHLAALRLIARVHDTHANIYGDKVLDNYFGLLRPAVQVRFVEGQAVVTAYYDAKLGPATGLRPGDVLLKVDGNDVADFVQARRELTPASNEPTQMRNIAREMLLSHAPHLALTVRREGKLRTFRVDCYPARELRNMAIESGTPDPQAPAWRLLPDNIGLLTIGTLRKSQVPDIMQAAQRTKGLIIDLRNYPADFVIFDVAQYLMPQKTVFVKFSGPRLTYPGLFPIVTPELVSASPGTPYAGKVVILVNELTQSSAEYHAMAFRAAPRAVVVGSTTAGADGNVSSITLPGNISTTITGLGVYYPDGRETQRVGIVPDVVVTPTIEGIRAGRDEVLERAVQLIETR